MAIVDLGLGVESIFVQVTARLRRQSHFQCKSTLRKKIIAQHRQNKYRAVYIILIAISKTCHFSKLSQRVRLCDSPFTIQFSFYRPKWLSTLTSHFQVSDPALKWSNSHKTLAYELRLYIDTQITFTQAFHCNMQCRLQAYSFTVH